MTEKEIEQKAIAYAKKHEKIINYHHDVPETDFEDKKNAFIAGAHILVEEIKQLKESKCKLRLRLMQRIHELSNQLKKF